MLCNGLLILAIIAILFPGVKYRKLIKEKLSSLVKILTG